MQDTEYYEKLLGLKGLGPLPRWFWTRLRVKVVCKSTVWAGDDGQRLHVHGYEQRRWRHQDTCQFLIFIEASVPRVVDSITGKTQMVRVPWAEPRSRWTRLFEQHVIQVLLACSTVTEAIELVRINWHQAHKMMESATQRGLERRKLEKINYVGLDEKSFRKGQDYISLMTDIEGQRVLEVQPGRDSAAVIKLWEMLPSLVREGVSAAAMDLGAAFGCATRQAAPHALIVYDRFHVSQLLSKAGTRCGGKSARC